MFELYVKNEINLKKLCGKVFGGVDIGIEVNVDMFLVEGYYMFVLVYND